LSILSIETARVFQPLLQPARDKGAYGGRGSGKSHFFAGLMIEDCLRAPGESAGEGLRSVCIREVQQDLAQSAKLLLESKLAYHRLGEADGFKVFESVIRTPGDGIIIFKGMNNFNADSIKSLEGFKRAWWEEAHGATKTSIGLLRPTMRAAGSEMWWSWNPRHQDDAVDVMLRGPELPTGAAVVEANWRDNPWFTAELEQERLDCQRMTPQQYGHIWGGEYISVVEGAYFAEQLAAARREGRIGFVPRDPLLPIRAYADIGGTSGRSDAFTFWLVQFVGLEIRVLAYYEAVGQEFGEHVHWLRSNGFERAEVVLPHDGLKHDTVYRVTPESFFRDAGFAVRSIGNMGAGAASARVDAIRKILPQCRFNETTCKGGLDALGWYHEKRDEARGIGLGPSHDWASHGADAFGSMAVDYEAPRKAAPLKRNTRWVV